MMFLLYFLLSPLLLLLSILFKLFPPTKINYIYGYRTRRSMQNQFMWDKANSYSSSLMVLFSGLLNVIQVIVCLLFPLETGLLITSAMMVFLLILILPLTEHYLKKFE